VPTAYLSFHELDEAAQGDWWAIGFAHEEPLEDDSVEVALGPPDQETVELHPIITQVKSRHTYKPRTTRRHF